MPRVSPAWFGTVIGTTHGGVRVYSNDDRSGDAARPMVNRMRGRFTGLRWQCVELARRYWLRNLGLRLPRVPDAADLWWRVRTVRAGNRRLVVPRRWGWRRGSSPPPIGSLVVWDRVDPADHGHVAIVVGRGGRRRRFVCVVEQNYTDQPLRGGGRYSRRLAVAHATGRLFDPRAPPGERPALGWLEPPRPVPLRGLRC